MNKKYGCDVVEYEELISKGMFSKHFIDDLQKFGVGEILRLNKRKKGMTSSGTELMCHFNVLSLVSSYGGRHIHGYLIEQDYDNNQAQLTYHSAWLTPEKKLVCVTPRESKGKRFKSNDTFFFMFPENASFGINYKDVVYHNDPASADLDREGFFFDLDSVRQLEARGGSMKLKIMPHQYRNYRSAKIKFKLNQERELNNIKLQLPYMFSKKSLLSKKSFDEIYKLPYAKKMRELFVFPTNKKHAKKMKKKRDVMSFRFSTS